MNFDGHKILQKVSRLDTVFLNGLLKRLRYAWSQGKYLKKIRSRFAPRIEIIYPEHAGNVLAQLCMLHGTDKGGGIKTENPHAWPPHSYADFYEILFGARRKQVRKVLECGIGTTNTTFAANMGAHGSPGASLRVWRDYFPNAEVIGLDLDETVLFSDQRIRTFQMDQTSATDIQDFWNELNLDGFDLIIDDGLHTYDAGITFFEGCAERLAPHGIFVKEDVFPRDLLRLRNYFENRSDEYFYWIVNLYRPGISLDDNSLFMVMRRSVETRSLSHEHLI